MNKGFSVKFSSVIQSMLKNATSRVKWGVHFGEIFENLFWVFQIGVFRPNLFKMFLGNLPDYLSSEKSVYISHTKIP